MVRRRNKIKPLAIKNSNKGYLMTMNDPYIPEDPFDPGAGMPEGAGVAPEEREVPEE